MRDLPENLETVRSLISLKKYTQIIVYLLNMESGSTPSVTETFTPETPAPESSTPVVAVSPDEFVLFKGPSVPTKTLPIPAIIMGLLGVGLLIYTIIETNINSNIRILGIGLTILWTLLWGLILWVLWRDQMVVLSWILLIVASLALLLFFILIIILKLGTKN